MATVEEAIVSLLTTDVTVSSLVATRVYPNYAPVTAALPRLIYTRTSSSRVQCMSGSVGMVEAAFQVICWAKTYIETLVLANAVVEALDKCSGTVSGISIDVIRVDNQADVPLIEPDNEEMDEHGCVIDFTVWYKE